MRNLITFVCYPILGSILVSVSQSIPTCDVLVDFQSASPYYVDSINGDDSFPGTSECPLKTITSAVQKIKDNDKIFVKNGVYHENIIVKDLDNIEISAIGDKVLIDGTLDVKNDLNANWEVHIDL